MALPLNITLDSAEPRILRDRLAITVPRPRHGDENIPDAQFDSSALPYGWDMTNSTGAIQDAKTGVVTFNFRQNEAAWRSGGGGDYARLRLADFDVADDPNWREGNDRFPEDYYLIGAGAPPAQLVSTLKTDYGQNQGWWFAYWSFGKQSDKFPQVKVIAGGWQFVFWTDGSVELWDMEDNFVASGSITRPEATTQVEPDKRITYKKQTTSQLMEVFIIPARKHEIWIRTSQGGACEFNIENFVDPNAAEPVIFAPSGFQFSFLKGQPKMWVAPLRAVTEMVLLTEIHELREAPETGAAVSSFLYYEGPYRNESTATTYLVELVDAADPSVAFVTNGARTSLRVKVTVHGTGESTPYIHGVTVLWTASLALTDASEALALEGFAKSASLSVGEEPDSTKFDVTLKQVYTLEALTNKPTVIANRPFLVGIGTLPLFAGRTKEPHWAMAPTDDATWMTWRDIPDWWGAFEEYQFVDAIPYDGWWLHDAVSDLVMSAGFDETYLDIHPVPFQLDFSNEAALGKWGFLPKVGDSPAKWLLDFHKQFAANTIQGWVPTADGWVYRMAPLDLNGLDSFATVFLTYDEARQALVDGGMDGFTARWSAESLLVESYEAATLEPEATEIRVTGWSGYAGKAFQVFTRNYAALNPTLAPSARPVDWTGTRRRVGVFNPGIKSYYLAQVVLALLAQRLFPPREVAEWTCRQLWKPDGSPIWKGDNVTIPRKGIYRVLNFSVDYAYERQMTSQYPLRQSRYTGEWIAPAPESGYYLTLPPS
jgi:hypothetical protein